MSHAAFRVLVSVCLCALVIALGLTVGAVTSHAWPDGDQYQFWYSGALPGPSQWMTRTYGDQPTLFTAASYNLSFADSSSTAGLPPNQLKLLFQMSVLGGPGPASGLLLGVGNLMLNGIDLPPGATYLPQTALVTYSRSTGGGPLATLGPYGSGGLPIFQLVSDNTYKFDLGWPALDSGVLLANPDTATYEITVDNVPEPLTLGLLAASAGILAARMGVRKRR